jgi:hypothetical protein
VTDKTKIIELKKTKNTKNEKLPTTNEQKMAFISEVLWQTNLCMNQWIMNGEVSDDDCPFRELQIAMLTAMEKVTGKTIEELVEKNED